MNPATEKEMKRHEVFRFQREKIFYQSLKIGFEIIFVLPDSISEVSVTGWARTTAPAAAPLGRFIDTGRIPASDIMASYKTSPIQ